MYIPGHSQTKYLSGYLDEDRYTVMAYSGYKTRQFLHIKDVFDAVPRFNVIAVVVGANDIGSKRPAEIEDDIRELCEKIRQHNSR